MNLTRAGLPLSVQTRPLDQGRVRIIAEGELDIATSPYLRTGLSRALNAGHGVELDLSRVSFMDSTGISVIVQALADFDAADCSFELSPELSDQVRRLLALVGVLSRLPFRGPAPSGWNASGLG
jgi:anti-sigma B factor antagonist